MVNGGLGRGLSSLIPNLNPSNQANQPAAAISETGERVVALPIGQIESNPFQPREKFDYQQLEELVESIKKHGIIQPLIVTKTDRGYQLIAGERRLRAAEIIELETVPAIVRTAENIEKLELALIENLQRENLNPIEEAKAFQRLMEEFNLTQEQIGERVGKNRSTVANTLRLLDLPGEIKQALIEKKITAGHAKVILSVAGDKERTKLYKKIIEVPLTVRSAEQTIRKVKVRSHERQLAKDSETLAQEDQLRKALNTKVTIIKKAPGGTIQIEFYSLEELNSLLEKLTGQEG